MQERQTWNRDIYRKQAQLKVRTPNTNLHEQQSGICRILIYAYTDSWKTSVKCLYHSHDTKLYISHWYINSDHKLTLSFTKPITPALMNFKVFSIGLTACARITKPIRCQDYSFISTVDPLNHVYRPRTTANVHNELLPLIKLHNSSKY